MTRVFQKVVLRGEGTMNARMNFSGYSNFLPSVFRAFIFLFLLVSVYGGCGGGGGTPIPTPPPTIEGNKLNIQILDAFIGDDGHPVATIKLTDENGNPITIDGVDIRFIIARLPEDINDYDEYIDYITTDAGGSTQATSESDGEYDSQGGGVYVYTFATMLPADYDRKVTHTVALYGEKTIGSQTWVSNATFNFVPDGSPVKDTRDIVSVTSCNNCHDPLALHGGVRRDTKVCITCHTTKIINSEGQLVDQIRATASASR